MNVLMRPITALCTIVLLALTVPAFAQKATLSTADRQVCCTGTDAAGNRIFFLAPKSQCPRNRVVALERCKGSTSRPVCCKTPNGYIKVGSAKRCKAAGGSIVSGRYCRQQSKRVCCKTRKGFAWTPSTRCRRPYGAPVNPRYCRQQNKRVCCETRKGYTWLPASKCRPPTGSPVNAKHCRQTSEKICCRYVRDDGTVAYGLLDPRRCKAVNGNKVSNRYCLKPRRDLKRLRPN